MSGFDYDGDGDVDALDDALLLEEELYDTELNEVNRLYRQGYSVEEIYEKCRQRLFGLSKYEVQKECEYAKREMVYEEEKRRKKAEAKRQKENQYTFSESIRLVIDLIKNGWDPNRFK